MSVEESAMSEDMARLQAENKRLFEEHRIAMNLLRENTATLEAVVAERAITGELRWQPIEMAPKDTAVLIYGFGYEVAHFNSALGKWVACWDHRPIREPIHWQPLPPEPPQAA